MRSDVITLWPRYATPVHIRAAAVGWSAHNGVAFRRTSAALSDNKFQEVAGETLETLQDQLDTVVESGVADGDVSLEVCTVSYSDVDTDMHFETLHIHTAAAILGTNCVIVTSMRIHMQDGVLTVNLGQHGTYVLNKQGPNRQIWSSSPVSGPVRYDWIHGKWVYKRDGHELFERFSKELSQLLGLDITLSRP